jgi:hypothetical protein
MNDFQEYNSLLPSILGDENLKNNIAQEANAEAEKKKQEITEPFNLVGSELFKGELDKAVKTGVGKIQKGLIKQGQQVGQKVAKAVGDKVSQATGVDVSKVAGALGKGDISGAIDEGTKAVGKAVGDKVSQAQKAVGKAVGDKVAQVKNAVGAEVDKGTSKLKQAQGKAQDALSDAEKKAKNLISKGKDAVSNVEGQGKNLIAKGKNAVSNVEGQGKNLISKGKNVIGDTEKLGKTEISNRISNLDDDLKNKVLDKLRKNSDKLVGKNLSQDEIDESMRATGQKYLAKAEKAQAKRDKPPPKQEEDDVDDDDEMPLLEDQEGNVITDAGGQADRTPTDQEAQDLWNKIKNNFDGDTAGEAGEATEENLAPTSSKPSNEPDFQDDFENQPQGLLDKMLGKKPQSKYVGGETDPEVELQTKADQAQQKAESQALRDKYNPPPKADEEDLTPSTEENPFLFDKSLFSDTNTTSAEASENFVKSLTSSKDYIPPSQQTGGQDATKVGDDAGYNRGQQKIPAKVEPKDDDDDFEESGQDNNPFPPPKAEDDEDDDFEESGQDNNPFPPPKTTLTQTESLTAEPAKTDTIDYDPKDLPPPVEDTPIPPKTDTIDYDPKDLPPPVEDTPIPPPVQAPPPVVQAPPPPAPLQQSESLTAEPVNTDIQQADTLSSNVDSAAESAVSGLKKTETITQDLVDATAASTAGDENPIGDIITAGIGLATLISPLFSSPHKVLPTQYLNPSSQFGA